MTRYIVESHLTYHHVIDLETKAVVSTEPTESAAQQVAERFEQLHLFKQASNGGVEDFINSTTKGQP